MNVATNLDVACRSVQQPAAAGAGAKCPSSGGRFDDSLAAASQSLAPSGSAGAHSNSKTDRHDQTSGNGSKRGTSETNDSDPSSSALDPILVAQLVATPIMESTPLQVQSLASDQMSESSLSQDSVTMVSADTSDLSSVGASQPTDTIQRVTTEVHMDGGTSGSVSPNGSEAPLSLSSKQASAVEGTARPEQSTPDNSNADHLRATVAKLLSEALVSAPQPVDAAAPAVQNDLAGKSAAPVTIATVTLDQPPSVVPPTVATASQSAIPTSCDLQASMKPMTVQSIAAAPSKGTSQITGSSFASSAKPSDKDANKTDSNPKPAASAEAASDTSSSRQQSSTAKDSYSHGGSGQDQGLLPMAAVVSNSAPAGSGPMQAVVAATATPSSGGPFVSSTRAENAAHVSVSQPHIPIAAPVINSAKLIQSIGQSEMRVGLQSPEFGNISIHTSASSDLVSAQISLEHDGLARALATHLPDLQSRNAGSQSMDIRISHSSQGGVSSGLDNSSASGNSDQHRAKSSARNTSVPVTNARYAGATIAVSSASVGGYEGRLDIQA